MDWCLRRSRIDFAACGHIRTIWCGYPSAYGCAMSDDKVLHWSFETEFPFSGGNSFSRVTVDTIRVFVVSYGEKFEIVDVLRLPNIDSRHPANPEQLSKSDLLYVVQNKNILDMALGALGVQKFLSVLQ
jgi:hypothetical protein